jgi:hypothetical protein
MASSPSSASSLQISGHVESLSSWVRASEVGGFSTRRFPSKQEECSLHGPIGAQKAYDNNNKRKDNKIYLANSR